MVEDRTGHALERIEAAVRRIEKAAKPPADHIDSELEERYRALWSRANTALAEIDSLIGMLEP